MRIGRRIQAMSLSSPIIQDAYAGSMSISSHNNHLIPTELLLSNSVLLASKLRSHASGFQTVLRLMAWVLSRSLWVYRFVFESGILFSYS